VLKEIHRVPCSPALAACQSLMKCFALWLCEQTTDAESITQNGFKPPILPTEIEADWLWRFLQKTESEITLLNRAEIIATLPTQSKTALSTWIQDVSALPAQFLPAHGNWPALKPPISSRSWSAFKTLMQAFYKKGLHSTSGLPYLPDGTPVAEGGVTYSAFVQEFRNAHRLNPDPNAREVCVLCGGPLGESAEVDHWIAQSGVPLFSVCSHNLLPTCGTCNSTTNKGEKDVHDGGSFANWFHPYLRAPNGSLTLGYDLLLRRVTCTSTQAIDQPKVEKLNRLLNLRDRWTSEFKQEYAGQQAVLSRRERIRIQSGQPRHTQAEVLQYLQQIQADLVPSKPHHEVHQVLCVEMLRQARLAAWQSELGLLS
jgi:hypothetical protein